MDEKKQKNIIRGLPIFPILIILVSLLSSILPELASVFIFDRNALVRGEIWRMFTCHFVHFSYPHLAYNIFAFGIAGYVIKKKNYPRFCLLYLCLAFTIGISLFILRPTMYYYGGLSGIACGALYYAALKGIKEIPPWKIICVLIVLCLPIKIAIEIYNNTSVLPYWEHQSFVPMHTSHIIGCLVAASFYLAEIIIDKCSNRVAGGFSPNPYSSLTDNNPCSFRH